MCVEERSVQLIIQLVFAVAPQVIPFSFGEGSLTAGLPITVQCMILEGDLPITFMWMFYGRELSSQMGISTFRLNPRVSLLSIDAVAAGHAGNYTCSAKNPAGITNHTATLSVNGLSSALYEPCLHYWIPLFQYL